MSKPTPYYVVMERPRHGKYERPVWGHPTREVAEADATTRTKTWGHVSVYRVAPFVEDVSERIADIIKESMR